MATTIFTPSMLRGVGTRGVPEIPVGSSYENVYSMAFDGVDDYFDCGTLSSLVDNKSKLSISLWVKFTNAGVTNRVAGKYVGLNKWLAIGGTSDTISFVVSGIGSSPNENLAYVQSNAVLSDNTWHHVVCVFDGTQGTLNNRGKIYIDGSDESATYNRSFPSATYNFASEGSPPNWNLARNGYAPTSDELEGNMDEYSIYSGVALTPTMVGEIYNSGIPTNLNTLATAPTPDLWYRMGDKATWDGTDFTLVDQGSGGNNATSDNMDFADKVADVPS